jgi:hypothetical protein
MKKACLTTQQMRGIQMEHGQNIIHIQEVNANEQNEIVEKNCLDCEFCKADFNGDSICIRRMDEGVVYKLDRDMMALNCPARDAMVWDEEIDENGEFEVDKELECGYWAYVKKFRDSRMDIGD